ncbi:MAG: dethiobiotin synthase [Bacteroidetes bacterium]|nr:dethiobiotin synthase [Bacteroidota bacterium]
MNKIIFISGIDTGCGKTVATGLMARRLKQAGCRVITQKIVQTGCTGISEDILTHRRLMDEPLHDVDRNGITCPYVFGYPASPHLSAAREGRTIDLENILDCTEVLRKKYDFVLIEGAGGVHVPLTGEKTILDYIEMHGYPMVLVTTPVLGSINHTLMSIELAWRRGIKVKGLIYNRYFSVDEVISSDSLEVFTGYLHRFFPGSPVICIPDSSSDVSELPDFRSLFS